MYGSSVNGVSLYAHVSVWGWVLGGLSAIVVGMIWYSPFLFGKEWTKAMGVNEKEMAKGRAKVMPILVIVSLLTAYVLSLFTVYLHSYVGNSWMMAAFDASVLAWVGFAGTAVVAHGVWDPRPKSALYINLGNRLATLVVMGLIIGAFLK
jgi:hypothetical protein